MSSIVKELSEKITQEQEDRWIEKFNRYARYVKPFKTYKIGRHVSTDTRELFLMYVADLEDIDYVGKEEEVEDEVA